MTSWSERDWWTLVFKGFQVRGDVVEAIAESISDVLTALRHEVPTATRWKGIKDPFERTERLVDHVDANRRSDVLIAALWRALHAQVGLRYLLQPVEPFADSARPLETPQPAAQPPSLDDTVVPNTPVEAPLAAASESVVDEAASLDRITSALNLACAFCSLAPVSHH